jgi:hypothetical protein
MSTAGMENSIFGHRARVSINAKIPTYLCSLGANVMISVFGNFQQLTAKKMAFFERRILASHPSQEQKNRVRIPLEYVHKRLLKKI